MIMVKKATNKNLQHIERRVPRQKQAKSIRKNGIGLSPLVLGLLIFAGSFIVMVFGWISGAIPLTVKYVECGAAPVIVTSNLAGATNRRIYSGDSEYGPRLFSTYECMTPAEKNGTRYRIENYPY